MRRKKHSTSNIQRPTPKAVTGARPWLLSALALLALFFLAPTVHADVTTEFESANKLYEQGKFREAADTYSKLISSGATSPALFFNLGNAHFKAGQIGEAIVAYRQAERLKPRDADVKANLQFARERVSGPTLKPARWQQFTRSLTTNEWTLLALLPVWTWFTLLIARQLKPSLKPALRTATFTVGAAALLACATLACVLHLRFNERLVVVTERNAIARFGPLPESQSAFTASDGAELRWLDSQNGWVQVSDDDKTFGWLKTNSVVVSN